MAQSDCSSYCDPQIFKTDGSAAGEASIASANTQSQVLCSQCTSQCGSSVTTTAGGGIRKRHKRKSKKTKRRKHGHYKSRKINRRKTSRKRHRTNRKY